MGLLFTAPDSMVKNCSKMPPARTIKADNPKMDPKWGEQRAEMGYTLLRTSSHGAIGDGDAATMEDLRYCSFTNCSRN